MWASSKRGRRRARGRACGIRRRARLLAQCNAICEAIDSGIRDYLVSQREKLPQPTLISLGLEKDVTLLTKEEIEREVIALAAYYKEQFQIVSRGDRVSIPPQLEEFPLTSYHSRLWYY